MGNSDRINAVDSDSGGGIAGSHPSLESAPVYVAPANKQQHNVIVNPLVPIACWRVDDVRFDFDSSFVLPEAADEMSALADLRTKHTLRVAGQSRTDKGSYIPPPLSLFGHADPVGNDDYNKKLSGRRATAVYAMLTRKPSLWESLYSQSFGGDNWGTRALSTMLSSVDPSLNGDTTTLQRKISDAQSNSGTRSNLYSSYMDKVCGTLKLDPADFLGKGQDSGGKSDYQGCGEFNPVVLFSQQEEQDFSDPDNKQKRNAANAPNRRVIGLLFRPGSKVDTAKWPCPRATDGVSGCVKRFWSDGDTRRNTHLDGQRRRFEKTHDTFACRFYQRLAYNSPCERVESLVTVQFLYEDKTPMANAEYRAVFDDTTLTGTTDKNGNATIAPPEDAPDQFTIFLTTVPEKYSNIAESSEGDTPDASSSDSSDASSAGSPDVVASQEPDGPATFWPHNILASVLLALLLLPWMQPAIAQTSEWPHINALLKGPIYRDGGSGGVELSLNLDLEHPSGTVTFTGLGTFTMLNPKLEIVEMWGPLVDRRARYRLQYETDRCENVAALPPDVKPAGWNPCFYVQGQTRPQLRTLAEITVMRERLRDRDVLTAIGIADVRSMTEVFRAFGSVAR